jgi:hypothetical protein
MRPPENNLNRIRSNRGMERRRMFILAFEGYRTEVQYFEGVMNNLQRMRIPSLVEVCPLNRYPSQTGCCSPLAVLDLLEEYMKFLESGKYHTGLFVNTFINGIFSDDEIHKQSEKINTYVETAKKKLLPLCDENDLIKDMNEAVKRCSEVYHNVFGVSEEIHFIGAKEMEGYKKGRDTVCVIVDRDAESRDPAECKEFFTRCRKNNFEPYMTNPRFELWLLLHFDEVLNEKKEVLLLNKKTGNIRYTEQRLNEILRLYPANRGKEYRKDDLDFTSFMHRVDNAIKNEKKFYNEIRCITKKVGSNIGSLIEKMRRRD